MLRMSRDCGHCRDHTFYHVATALGHKINQRTMKEPKKRGRPAKADKQTDSANEISDDVPEAIIYAKSASAQIETFRGRETLDLSVVYRVETEIGRTANAWGMIDPLELIRAVDRVLRGGEG